MRRSTSANIILTVSDMTPEETKDVKALIKEYNLDNEWSIGEFKATIYFNDVKEYNEFVARASQASTKVLTMKVELEFDYEADPKDYNTGDVSEMKRIDEEQLSEHPDVVMSLMDQHWDSIEIKKVSVRPK